jgi:hypothetical protein
MSTPTWQVIRTTGYDREEETFHTFADAWAYAQPDPEYGISEYRTKDSVQRMMERHREVTIGYEGDTKIRLRRGGGSMPRAAPSPPACMT